MMRGIFTPPGVHYVGSVFYVIVHIPLSITLSSDSSYSLKYAPLLHAIHALQNLFYILLS